MMKKTAVSVRINMAKTLPEDSNTSEFPSVPVLIQYMCLVQVPESASVPFTWQANDGNLTRLENLKDKHVEKEEDNESEDDHDVFSDALDTLSLKHSVSGMTPPRPCEDPQPRDFMLNPMTVVQQSQYALKQQPLPVMSEPMRKIRDIVPANNHATPKRYESITSPSYFQGLDDEESEDDEDDEEVSEYLSKRGCGMMSPQLCFKGSLGMLSSVHGLKEKPYSMRTSSHDQVKSSKVAQLKSRFQSVKKLALDSIYKQKLGSRAQSPLHPGGGKKSTFAAEQLDSNMSTASRPSSPYRQTACMSPYRTAGNISPLHPAGFPGTRKEAEIMRANRLNKHIRNKSQELLYPKSTRLDCSTSSVMEKTLYVDTEIFPKTRHDKGNSNIKILPETVETLSKEPELAGNKPKATIEHQAVETLPRSSGIKKMEADELEKNNSDCPLAPPPPKKPSDSWLFRKLPSVSSKIPSRRYLFHPQKKNLEENSTSVTKWENIVKTSCMHRDHIRYSEELVGRSSCRSKNLTV